MDNKHTILAELYKIGPELAKIGKCNPYDSPAQSYFDGLAARMLGIVKSEKNTDLSIIDTAHDESGLFSGVTDELNAISPLLAGLSKKNPYSIPAGYFQELPSGIIEGAKAIDAVNEEIGLEKFTALDPDLSFSGLDNIRRINVYAVPDLYFNEFPEKMQSRVGRKEPAKLVSMGFSRKLFRYAAAAVVSGLLLAGALFYMTGKSSPNITLAANQQAKDSVTGINKVSETEMVNYLKYEPSSVPDVTFASTGDMTSDDLLEMLSDVSDESLQHYLAQYSDAKAFVN